MKENESPSYYAIIPANVRYNKKLTPRAILLYGEITALCSKHGYCWATNQYFANLYSVSKVSVSKWISELEQGGYIETHIKYKEPSNQVDKRYIRILIHPIKENFNTPIKENLKDNKDNNTSFFSNTSNSQEQSSSALFPEFDIDKKSLFKNSTVGNIIAFKQQFKDPVYSNIDLDYYFNAIADWNEIKKVKRTAKGWLATARNFMRKDNEKKKLRTLDGNQEILSQEQIDYLKM
jgi:hypothetical protein